MSGMYTVSSGDLVGVSGGDLYPYPSQSLDYGVLYSAVYDATLDAVSTYAQTVTDGEALNSSAISYFQGILQNQMMPVDYVVYVGQPYNYYSGNTMRTAYEYCMAYGDLTESNEMFTGRGTVVRMRVTGITSVVYEHDQTISLKASPYYSRSNLGDYSGIYAYDWSGFLLLVSAMIGGVTWLIKKLMRLKY